MTTTRTMVTMTITMTMTMVTIITIHHLMMITNYGQVIEDGRLKMSKDQHPPTLNLPTILKKNMRMMVVLLVELKYTITTTTTTTTTTHLSRLPLHPILPTAQCIFPFSTKLQARLKSLSLLSLSLPSMIHLKMDLIQSKTTYQDAHMST